MEQYIPKSALLAEIERLRKNQRLDDRHGQWVLDGLHAIERFINTLEVQEVDLEKEIQDSIYNRFFDLEGIAIAGSSLYATVEDMVYVAKHFFELGLKAQKGE